MLTRTRLLAVSLAAFLFVAQAGYAAEKPEVIRLAFDRNLAAETIEEIEVPGETKVTETTEMVEEDNETEEDNRFGEDETFEEAGEEAPSVSPLPRVRPIPSSRGEDSSFRPTLPQADLAGPVIEEISLEGNVEVDPQHIMSVVTSQVGDHVDEENLRKDAEAIFELGFFNTADYRVTDLDEGVRVTFVVQENPTVGEIRFVGNSVYGSEELSQIVFTQPGMIFNRTFFRNDLQRIREKYQADGYVMANVRDVRIEGDIITVEIIEPRIVDIIIQGNRITKTHLVERYIRVKRGENFNSNELRLTLNRLQGLGYFSDVNVNFEQGEAPDEVVLVFTVEEARTGRLGFNVSYGTQSGFGGGISYENSNIWGTGLRLNVGFDLGDREQYWLTVEQPYMSDKIFAWRVGLYRRAWDDIYYYEDDTEYLEYDRERYGAFVGFGKKFSAASKFNWYMLLDWHKTKNDNLRFDATDTKWDTYPGRDYYTSVAGIVSDILQEELGEGEYYSATATIRRFALDEYLPYQKGSVQSVNVQVGSATVEETDYNFVKYWLEGRFYYPISNFLKDLFESSLFEGVEGKPVTFAARVIAGSASGDVPYDELYEVGGDTTLRGYDDDYYHGRNIVLGNFELRIPIQKMLSFVLFYDIGRAWDSGRTYPGTNIEKVYGDDDWGMSPGVGIRLNTPLGNIRLDYASGDEERFSFGFGELF